jgi:uncharacterized cupredoxin-like copper-binding protein
MSKLALAAITLATMFAASPALAAPGAAGQSHAHSATFAAGEPGDANKPSRTVKVIMREDGRKMLFEPNKITVRKGEQIRFVLDNAGAKDHEFVLSTVADNRKHAAQMRKNPEMEHDDPNAARLAAALSGELLWKFTKAGTFEFACLIPGHYEAGMRGTVVVK